MPRSIHADFRPCSEKFEQEKKNCARRKIGLKLTYFCVFSAENWLVYFGWWAGWTSSDICSVKLTRRVLSKYSATSSLRLSIEFRIDFQKQTQSKISETSLSKTHLNFLSFGKSPDLRENAGPENTGFRPQREEKVCPGNIISFVADRSNQVLCCFQKKVEKSLDE